MGPGFAQDGDLGEREAGLGEDEADGLDRVGVDAHHRAHAHVARHHLAEELLLQHVRDDLHHVRERRGEAHLV